MAVAVEPHGISKFAAQKLIHRHPKGFASEIPERDFDAGHCGDGGASHCAVEEPRSPHFFEEHIDVERILADDAGRQRNYHCRAAFAAVDALAVADYSLISEDADIGRVPMPLDLGSANVGNFHVRFPCELGGAGASKLWPVSRLYSSSLPGEGG